jgi:hypothetical protein
MKILKISVSTCDIFSNEGLYFRFSIRLQAKNVREKGYRPRIYGVHEGKLPRRRITVTSFLKALLRQPSLLSTAASGPIFKDDVNDFTTTSDI